ncbi:hypothetical protein K432DRAFT_305344 [Lepidopterella palustris CBS 459.81]|uniref:Histidine kinase n=1 Tax=Lepidopterella palustris CBS 459.81 TaxID=1314670 RepID=A0A8E2E4A1_9PEZI|nr:hypothetical protein K432DRAFT_305344 [Lepidopterella palustris CBS 459.81]
MVKQIDEERPRKRQRISDPEQESSSLSLKPERQSSISITLPSPEASTEPGDESRDETRVDPPENPIDWTRYDIPDLPAYITYLRNYDWAKTALGPIKHWGKELRSNMFLFMNNPDPRVLLWGPELALLYNEACAVLMGPKHPAALGLPGAIGFAEGWEPLYKNISKAMQSGRSVQALDHYVPIARNGLMPEETYWSYSLMPILDDQGSPVGIVKELNETTSRVISQRRLETSAKVENMGAAEDITTFWNKVLGILESNKPDFPFSLLYSVVDDTQPPSAGESAALPKAPKRCVLEGVIGIKADHPLATPCLDITEEGEGLQPYFKKAWTTGGPIMLRTSDKSLPRSLAVRIAGRGLGGVCKSALLCPVRRLDGPGAIGFLIIGMNPRRPYDEDYRNFIKLFIDHLVRAAASIIVPEEQRSLLRRTKKAESQERTFTRLAELAPVGLAIFSPKGAPMWMNDTYDQLSGIDRDDGKPNGWVAPVHPDDRPKVDAVFGRLSKTQLAETLEFRVRKRPVGGKGQSEEDQWRWLLSNASSEVDEQGTVNRITCFLTDISHHKRMEKLQAQRLDDALETKRQSENFIDMTCHEMRNPLSAIIQSADGILSALGADSSPIPSPRTAIPDHIQMAVVDAAQTIVLCAQHQKRIVDDILTLSKLDSNLLLISPDRVRPEALVRKAIQMYEADLSDAQVTTSFFIDQSYRDLAVDRVLLDPARLLQVLINLLTNAIKFTRKSNERRITILLGASLTRPSSGPNKVSYIPQRASRVDRYSSGEWGAGQELFLQFDVCDTGRGLTAEEMKLLFLRFSQASPKTYAQYGGSGLGLFISRELTELQGGQIGVHSIAGQGSTFTFYIKARRYVSDGKEEPDSTRTAMEDISQDTFRLPPKKTSLPASPIDTSPTKIDTPPTEPSTTLHILLVEDNLINQKVMAQYLRQMGATVHVANHGLEALVFLSKTTFFTKPQLAEEIVKPECSTMGGDATAPIPLSVILMDLEMPFMDGLTCVRRIREMQLNGVISAHVPVIAVTANARKEQISKALDEGMDEVVTKPFRIPELLPKIINLVERIRMRPPCGNG